MPLLAPLQADAPARRGRPSDPSRPRVVDRYLLGVVGLLIASVVLLDQATKELAVRALSRGRMVDVLADGWGFQLTYNDGGAWGFPAPYWFFLVVTVIVAVIVVRNLPHVQSLGTGTAYGLLMAGALGNAIDRVTRVGDPGDPRYLHGHVVDFLAIRLPVVDLPWIGEFGGPFPRFNVADVAITCGFFLLLVALWHEERAAETSTTGSDGHTTAPVRS